MSAGRQMGGSLHVPALIGLMILLYFFVGTQPFRDLNDDVSGSALLSQVLIMGLSATAWLCVLRQPELLGKDILFGIAALAGWLVVSALASAHGTEALRNGTIQIIFALNAYLILRLPRSEAEFTRILGIGFGIALLLSYGGVLLLPNVSIHQTGDIVEPMLAGLWRGHFMHKNIASNAMVVIVFFALYLHAVGSRRWAYLLGGAALFFLVQTGGKTSLALLPSVVLLAWTIRRFRALRAPLVLGGLLAFNLLVVGATFSRDLSETIASWGIDPTFTNRSDIWKIAVRTVGEHPWTGTGLHTFWGSYNNLYGGGDLETWAYAAGTAHNGYIDTVLNIGVPGAVLTAILFVLMPLQGIGRAIRSGNSTPLTQFFLCVWLYGLISAGLESVFFAKSGMLWFMFMMAAFGLRLQGEATLVSAAPVPDTNADRGAVYG